MKKRTLLLLMLMLCLLTAIGMQATSLYAKIANAQRTLPLRTEFFSFDAVSYDSSADEVVASFTYFKDITDSDIIDQMQMVSSVLGLLMISDPNMDSFNLTLLVKTPSKSEPTRYPYSKTIVGICMDEFRKAFKNNDFMLNALSTELDKLPMQCDPGNNFCYTLGFNSQLKEIQVNLQILSDSMIQTIENTEFNNSIKKMFGSILKTYKQVMTEENISLRVRYYKGTANTPFKDIRMTAAELFGE